MSEDREALKAKLEAELLELRKAEGDSVKDAKTVVADVKEKADDELEALEREARKLRVKQANEGAESRVEKRVDDADVKPNTAVEPVDPGEGARSASLVEQGESLEQTGELEHSEAANHGPEHDKLPGDEGDTRVLYSKPLPEDPAEVNTNLRELTVEQQLKRANPNG